MTRQEAIRWIQLDIDMAKFDPSTGEEAYLNDDARKVIEAQEMAIEALKANGPDINVGSTDDISRQAMLDEFPDDHLVWDTFEGYVAPHYVRKIIKALPSVQLQYEELTPEEAASEIASGSMMSAAYWFDAMLRLKQMGYAICRKNEVKDGTISRRAAIHAAERNDKQFMKLTVRNSNGRPYYSIIYLEFDDDGIGHDFEGYSSYDLDVISDYLMRYFGIGQREMPKKPERE